MLALDDLSILSCTELKYSKSQNPILSIVETNKRPRQPRNNDDYHQQRETHQQRIQPITQTPPQALNDEQPREQQQREQQRLEQEFVDSYNKIKTLNSTPTEDLYNKLFQKVYNDYMK